MDHSESGHQDRRPQLPQHYLQQQQQSEQRQEQSLGGRPHQPPPTGAQQNRSWLSQQQQQEQQQQQLQLYLQRDQHQEHHQGGNSGGRRPYNPSQVQPGDSTMNVAAAAPLTHRQNEYNISASMVAAAQQQQYLQQQQQQQQYEAAVATAGGNPGLVSVTQQQQQQQYAQQISYQQQLAMQQMAATAPIQPRGGTHQHLHHGSTSQQPHHTLHHPMVGPQQPHQQHPSRMDHPMLASAVAAGIPHPHVQVHQSQHHLPQHLVQQPQTPCIQPRVGRLQADRPLIKLTVSLIDTYKCINTVYYQEREARKAARGPQQFKEGSAVARHLLQQQEKKKASAVVSQQHGTNNNGWDDDNYDYIINSGELFYEGRYKLKERIGKGSFGQVVRAVDLNDDSEVAIKIIKSKKPFLMQAKTEIELLNHLNEKDTEDQHNIGEEFQSKGTEEHYSFVSFSVS